MALRTILLGATAVLGLASAAHARGWYVGLEAGANSIPDTPAAYRENPPPFTAFPEGRFDTGWALIATVGYAMQHWRIEGELAWRSNDKERFVFLVSTGDVDQLTAMYNMTYELPLSQDLGIALGGGAGLAYAMLAIPDIDDTDLNFAYQGIVQINYTLSPSTELSLGYRYLRVLDPEFADATAGVTYAATFDDFSNHALTLGVRFTFAP